MILMIMRKWMLLLLFACCFILSCTRKDIQFGDTPENSYTNIEFIDTVGVELSTVISDSFVTSSPASLLVGNYKDPYLGTVSAKNFFQMGVPAVQTTIPNSAKYDSVSLIFHTNGYYYGDTSLLQTMYVKELSDGITYSYNNKLYNTSNFPVKPTELGSKVLHIRPNADDSLEIRLKDAKGLELFSKLQQSSSDVINEDEFLNYFKGICLTTGDNDTTAIYGLQGAAGSILIRVYYHTTIPYPESQFIDFRSLANDLAFNQVIANRAGTGIVPGNSSPSEIRATQTNNLAFLQPGTGLFLKMIFPSLRNIILSDKIIKVLKAELIIRPAYLSFDNDKYKLPAQLYLTQTDETNTSGTEVLDSTGMGTQYAAPVVDDLYGENNYYRFDVTTYINQWINTAGSEDKGFFVVPVNNGSDLNVNRIIVNNSFHDNQSTRLLLSVIIIDK